MQVEHEDGELRIQLDTVHDTDRLGRAIAVLGVPDRVIGLVGPLGAGKTRLVRAMAEALGVDPRAVSSPTFVLIHEYEGRLPVYHFDAYRLGGPEPFEALGVADYWASGGVCLVEWADLVAELLPADTLWVTLKHTGETARTARIAGHDPTAIKAILESLRVEI